MRDDERLAAEMAAARAMARMVNVVPPDPASPPDPSERDAAILAWVLDQPASEHAWLPAPRRGRVVLLAAAAVLALIAVVSVPLGLWSSPAAATGTPRMLDYTTAPSAVVYGTAPEASDVLHDLADHAERSASTPGTGDIQHIASSNWFGHTQAGDEGQAHAVIYPTRLELWTAPDGSVVTRERRGPALDTHGRLTSEPDQGAPAEAGDVLPAGSADVGSIDALPRESTDLRQALLAPVQTVEGTDPPEAEAALLTAQIARTHASFLVPGDLTSAMWRVLAEEPGISYLGTVTDRAGRQAVAIAAPPLSDVGYTRVQVLLIDPETGELLGEEQVDLDNPDLGIIEPTVTGFTCYTAREWVDAIPPNTEPSGAATS